MNHWLRPGFGQPWSFKTQCLAITFSRKSSQISLQTGSFNILLTRSPPSFCMLPYMGKASLEPHPLDLWQRGWGLLLPRRDAGLLRRRLRRSSSPRSQQRLPGSGRQQMQDVATGSLPVVLLRIIRLSTTFWNTQRASCLPSQTWRHPDGVKCSVPTVFEDLFSLLPKSVTQPSSPQTGQSRSLDSFFSCQEKAKALFIKRGGGVGAGNLWANLEPLLTVTCVRKFSAVYVEWIQWTLWGLKPKKSIRVKSDSDESFQYHRVNRSDTLWLFLLAS